MIQIDRELRAILPEMQFETAEHQRPFQVDQVQPCSIDLRLDRCFWVPRKPRWHGTLDFRAPSPGAVDVQRLFRRRWLKLGEGITLKPGQMVLGRTFERFTIPNGYAGKIEGRSTFARLGLSIHCTGDFINPGWRGQMPLQLVNHGAVPVILTPYLPICQILVMRLAGPSDRPYGSSDLGSKYMNDQGEPSRYWQDARLQKLQEACGRANIPERVRKEFMAAIGSRDVEIVDRFLAFFTKLGSSDITSSREVLERFADVDTRRINRGKYRHRFLKWLPIALPSASLSSLLRGPYEWLHFALWGLTLVLLPFGIYHL